MNKIMLIGNLGRDPEMNYTPSGVAVTKFSLAVNRITKSSTGEREKETEWFNIVAWRQLAETCNSYLHKGSKVYIEGRLQQRKYTDKTGVERTAIDVIANDMEMLTPKSEQSGSSDFLAGNADDSDPLGDLEDHPF
ncbi:MAG TPA: single-stranded DNA-binding protein [Ktedonobacteraceae bacterium]